MMHALRPARLPAASVLILSLLGAPSAARGATDKSPKPAKLAVVIVVDQMPADTLDRFNAFFGDRGFRRLKSEGRVFSAARYAHQTTLTGPSHTVIGTGTYGFQSGIVANGWFDRATGRAVNCAYGPWKSGEKGTCSLSGWSAVPADARRVGNPCNLLDPSLGDRMKGTYPAARVVGVAMKDRSAILTLGKAADAAYWMDAMPDGSQSFVCSDFYPACSDKALAYSKEQGITEKPGDPDTMTLFRQRPAWRSWECSLPDCPSQCPDDVTSAHVDEFGLGKTFPHKVNDARALQFTPFGNDLLEGMAERVVEAHGLGKNPKGQPDLLVVGFSSTDYYGHLYGPDSCEVADGMKRLDATLARFLDFLVARVGRDNLLVVLTADHGVTPNVKVLLKRGIPAGRIDVSDLRSVRVTTIGELPELRQRMEFELARFLGIREDGATPLSEALIRAYRDPMFYLNQERVPAGALPLARAWLKDYLLGVEGIREAYTYEEVVRGEVSTPVRLSSRPERMGDVTIVMQPGWVELDESGCVTHGQPYDADARVPLLFWGRGVQAGTDASPIDMTRVASTLSAALGLDLGGLSDPAPLPLRGAPPR
jgi:hypothetical protein